MAKIRIDPLVSVVRFYNEDVDQKSDIPSGYTNLLILSHLDDGSVQINGAVHAPNISQALELKRELKRRGIKKSVQKRNGKYTEIKG